jgi:Zn-dependent M28 family amino/carboxypeptidase
MLLELARELSARRDELSRQVILAFFDAEEPPHFITENMGSMHFVAQPTFPLDRIDLMVCLDLVGHACGGPQLPPEVRGSLFVLGAELSRGTPALVDRVAGRVRGVWPRRLHADVIPPLSDYYAFWEAQVPFVFLSCGRWEHYHRPSDTPDRLDWEKIGASTAFLIDLTREASLRLEPEVEWLANGRDDAATVRTLHNLASLLLPLHPGLAPMLAQLDPLLTRREPLRTEERLQLSFLISGLEGMLV